MAFPISRSEASVGQAVTLYFLSPILVALAAKPSLRERTPLPQWAAILLGFVAVALASGISEFDFRQLIVFRVAFCAARESRS